MVLIYNYKFENEQTYYQTFIITEKTIKLHQNTNLKHNNSHPTINCFIEMISG